MGELRRGRGRRRGRRRKEGPQQISNRSLQSVLLLLLRTPGEHLSCARLHSAPAPAARHSSARASSRATRIPSSSAPLGLARAPSPTHVVRLLPERVVGIRHSTSTTAGATQRDSCPRRGGLSGAEPDRLSRGGTRPRPPLSSLSSSFLSLSSHPRSRHAGAAWSPVALSSLSRSSSQRPTWPVMPRCVLPLARPPSQRWPSRSSLPCRSHSSVLLRPFERALEAAWVVGTPGATDRAGGSRTEGSNAS